MRKFLILLVAAASLAALPAQADRGYAGQGGRGAPPPGAYHGQGGHPAQGYRGGYHGSGGYRGGGGYHGGGYYPWAGLALFGALAGFAILAESTPAPYVDPYYGAPLYGGPTLFIEQQSNASPYPAGNWYYCASSALYYPYTKACPEGWQAVPPNP